MCCENKGGEITVHSMALLLLFSLPSLLLAHTPHSLHVSIATLVSPSFFLLLLLLLLFSPSVLGLPYPSLLLLLSPLSLLLYPPLPYTSFLPTFLPTFLVCFHFNSFIIMNPHESTHKTHHPVLPHRGRVLCIEPQKACVLVCMCGVSEHLMN